MYRASLSWDSRMFKLDGFYRTGHYHWAYEGDFFGLYPEANYGPNIDIYNGEAPLGVEIEGKRSLNGLKVAFGPSPRWVQFDVGIWPVWLDWLPTRAPAQRRP